MITTLILTFVIIALTMVAMAIGVIANRKPIKGSCGGISALGIETSCEICGGDTAKCEQQTKDKQSQNQNGKAKLAYQAPR